MIPKLITNSFTVGSMDTNCYFVTDPESLDTIIIDPGDDGDFLSEQILEQKLNLTAIILTHGHFDHVLGLLSLQLNFGCPVYLHPADEQLFKTATKSAQHWLKRKVDPVPTRFEPIKPNQVFTLGQTSLTPIHTPGHTPGSICLYTPGLLFSGDTLFYQALGRTDFSYSKPLQLSQSLEKLWKLPLETHVLPGHGETTTLSAEKSWLEDDQPESAEMLDLDSDF